MPLLIEQREGVILIVLCPFHFNIKKHFLEKNEQNISSTKEGRVTTETERNECVQTNLLRVIKYSRKKKIMNKRNEKNEFLHKWQSVCVYALAVDALPARFFPLGILFDPTPTTFFSSVVITIWRKKACLGGTISMCTSSMSSVLIQVYLFDEMKKRKWRKYCRSTINGIERGEIRETKDRAEQRGGGR